MTSKFGDRISPRQDVLDRAKASHRSMAREIEAKSGEIEKLKYLLQDRTNQLAEVSVSYDQLLSKNTLMTTEVELKDKQIKSLIEKLDQVMNIFSSYQNYIGICA